MSRQQKADTIRSAGGKTQFQAIERVLRASEQAFEGQAQGRAWRSDKGYVADEDFEAYYGEVPDDLAWDEEPYDDGDY
eukprot:14633966-Alexandrium_andersonii.AAC.1